MIRKFIIEGEIIYGDSNKSSRILGEGSYTVGDFNSIDDCIKEVFEQAERSTNQVESAARFFGFISGESFGWQSITARFTNEDGSIFDQIVFKNLQELTKACKCINAFIDQTKIK